MKNFDKYFMTHQYMPKTFNDPHKTPPAPQPTYLMYAPLLLQLFNSFEYTHGLLYVFAIKWLLGFTFSPCLGYVFAFFFCYLIFMRFVAWLALLIGNFWLGRVTRRIIIARLKIYCWICSPRSQSSTCQNPQEFPLGCNYRGWEEE